MEDKTEYKAERKYGQVPHTSRIEIAYDLADSTMGLLGECSLMIGRVLEGKYVNANSLRDNLDHVGRMSSILSQIVQSETFSDPMDPAGGWPF